MAIHLKQGLKVEQQLIMTPQLQQSIQLLLLNRAELELKIAEVVAENPLLEDSFEQVDDLSPGVDDYGSLNSIDNQYDRSGETVLDKPLNDILAEGMDSYQTRFYDYSDEEISDPQERMTRPETLHMYLIEQLHLSTLSSEERRVANHIIGNIDARGYLKDISIPDLVHECNEDNRYGYEALEREPSIDLFAVEDEAEYAPVSEDDVSRVLRFIQYYFEPAGVAASSLSESLIIQLDRLHADSPIPHYILAKNIVTEYISLLEIKNYRKIAKALECSIDDVLEAVTIITSLEPIPGRAFYVGVNHYITPDIYVDYIDGDLVVRTNDDGIPTLKINDYYQNLVREDLCDEETKSYILEKARHARFFIDSVEERRQTIYKVTMSIVKFQREFFIKGIEYLKPLILKDIAEDIGVHESTVSRVTTNKYVATPRGLFELKYFFNSTISGYGEESFGSEAVKAKIREIIAAENTAKPLSDAKIADMLAEESNVDISRRTVAKYRESMNILPSSKRKKLL